MKKVCTVIILLLLMSMVGCNKKNMNVAIEDKKNEIFEVVEEQVLDVANQSTVTEKYTEEEKSDVAEAEKYNAPNRMFTSIAEDNQESLFCIDPNTGVVYFVNQNKDWYIYRIKNDEVSVAVELPARELYMWEGVLYFIVEDYNQYELVGVSENSIYAYTPEEGKVQLIYRLDELENSLESHLGVDEDGIYIFFSKAGEKIEVNGKKGYLSESFYYRIPFGNSKLLDDPYKKAVMGWKEFYYIGKTFVSRTGADFMVLDVPASMGCIIDDSFYSVSSNQIEVYITDMITQEVVYFDCKPLVENVVPGGIDTNTSWIFGFTVTKEYIWVAVAGKYIVRIEPETGEMNCYEVGRMVKDVSSGELKLQIDESAFIDRLYTDGINIYARYQKNGYFAPGVLVRLNTEEPQILAQSKVPMIICEELTE